MADEKKDVDDEKKEAAPVIPEEERITFSGTKECPLQKVDFSVTGDLDTDREALKKAFSSYAPLYKRKFVESADQKKGLAEYEIGEQKIRMLQFNMLADGLSGSYFKNPSKNPSAFVDSPADSLKWAYRGLKIVEVLLEFEPDIITIEECDAPWFIAKYLEPGYTVHWSSKGGSAISETAASIMKDCGYKTKLEMAPDGFLIAFKTTKFALLKKQVIEKSSTKSGVSALALHLVTSRTRPSDYSGAYCHTEDGEFDTNEILDDRFEFIVASTHLKAKKAAEGEKIRANQLKELLDTALDNPRNVPVVIGADFNATPTKSSYGYDAAAYPLLADRGYVSAYAATTGSEPAFTTHKKRAKGTDKHCIDYIVSKEGYYRELRAIATLDISEEFGASTMPNWSYPSDHIAIGAEFVWRVLAPDDNVAAQGLQTDKDGKTETWPLPGQEWSHVKQTGDWRKDLAELKKAYRKKYRELVPRKKITCIEDSKVKKSHRLKICQFNLLADGLCGGYIKVNDDKSFLAVDKECLRLQYRGLRLLEALLEHDPDLLALQECDVPDFFGEYLEAAGYKYKWQEKYNSPIFRKVSKRIAKFREWPPMKAPFPMANDGLLVAWKADKFEKTGIQRLNSNETDSGLTALAVRLKSKTVTVTKDGKSKPLEIIYASTHLKSTKAEEGEIIRVSQMKELFELLVNPEELPVMISCDLNANPVVNQKGYEPWCYQAITTPLGSVSKHSDAGHGYSSIYQVAGAKEPEFTTWKLRKHGTDKHTIDYVFLRYGKWRVVSYLDMPEIPDKTARSLIPSWDFPSDHFPLVFEIDWDDAAKKEIGW